MTPKKTMPLCLVLLGLLAPTAPAALGASEPARVPGTQVAYGKTILEATLVAPTRRYAHFVRGNTVEAAGLRLVLAGGRVLTLTLPDDQVFEDDRVRLADLDGDGAEEAIVVLTSLTRGASLAVFGVAGEAIELRAQTPYIGLPRRWLNPAAIADFDGDGRPEIALVEMPHLVKQLELWRLEGRRLVRVLTVDDVTNHRLGSAHTQMAAAADFDGDGIPDLALPDGARASVRFLSFAAGRPREVRRVALPDPADGDFALRHTAAGGWQLTVLLEGGRAVTIGP